MTLSGEGIVPLCIVNRPVEELASLLFFSLAIHVLLVV